MNTLRHHQGTHAACFNDSPQNFTGILPGTSLRLVPSDSSKCARPSSYQLAKSSRPGLLQRSFFGGGQLGSGEYHRQFPSTSKHSAKRVSVIRQAASGSDDAASTQFSEIYFTWDQVTNTLTACSTVANLFMMMPQLLKNAGALSAGHPAELAGLSWIAFSTGYLGNMLLLSYFTQQKQLSACLVQVVGGASTLALLTQVHMAGYMPTPAYAAVCGFFVAGCLTNGLRFTGALPESVWGLWQDFVGLLGLAVLPQVICSSFLPYKTFLPAGLAFLSGVVCLYQIKSGSASQALVDTWQKLGGWTATLLFMFMPLAQLQSCLVNPANLATMSPVFNVLGLIANGLMIPRALFTRDLIWFTGSTWGALMMGWGMLLALATNSYIPMQLFIIISGVFFSFLGFVLTMNAKAHNLKSPIASILYLKP